MIGLYSPDIPPVPGGVSDHTLVLARALQAQGAPPSVLAMRGDSSSFAPLPCRLGLGPMDVADAAAAMGVTALLVQFVPFLFARRGLSLSLCLGLRKVARTGIAIAVVVHEPYVPFTRIPWLVTGWPMRWQLRYLLSLAAFVYAPVPRYVDISRRYAGPGTRVALAPIGATLPTSSVSRADARSGLGLGEKQVAIGVFSPAASGFLLEWVDEARAVLAHRPDVVWICFGFGSERLLRAVPAGNRLVRVTDHSAAVIGRTMRALDLAAAPYVDGLTMRRTSAMFALAHGVPVVSSTGPLFDPALAEIAACEPSAAAFAARLGQLAEDPEQRARLADKAKGYRTRASVEVLARQILHDLGRYA